MPRWLGDALWWLFMPAMLVLSFLIEAAPYIAVVLAVALAVVLACR